MSILLIRHGETALNAARVLQPADTPLSDRGIVQAEALAMRLASIRLARILSSDLPRALSTARTIAATTGAPIAATSLLQERNFGALRGCAYDSLAINPITSDDAPPGGESGLEFAARIDQAWLLIAATDEAIHATPAAVVGDLAVVTHGLVIRALLARVMTAETLPAQIGNTSLSVLDRAAPTSAAGNAKSRSGWVASRVNCTLHLQGDWRDDPQALSGG